MKICKNCGHENSDSGKFCEECGTKLEGMPKFCPECGFNVVDNNALNKSAEKLQKLFVRQKM